VNVHSRAIVAEQRLGHERSRHAALACDILDHVFVDHHVVGHPGKRSIAHVDLALAPGCDFMVMSFNSDAEFFQDRYHIGAGVLELIGRRHWEVTLFRAQLVSEARPVFTCRIPVGLNGIDFVIAVVGTLVVTHFIENKVLELRAEIGCVTDAGALEIGFRLLRDISDISAIVLSRDRIADVADQH
jgi:hypothetical protein